MKLLPILLSASFFLGNGAAAQTSVRKVSNEGGVLPDLADAFDRLGTGLEVVGDLDGDGIDELALGSERGEFVTVLFMNADGSIRTTRRIEEGRSGFVGPVDTYFGAAVTGLGDLDGDGTPDMAVGEPNSDSNRGAVWILFLAPDGTVKAESKIANGVGGLAGALSAGAFFGSGLARMADTGGGVRVAIGARGQNKDRGAVYVIGLSAAGTVQSQKRIAQSRGGFTGHLEEFTYFGEDVSSTDIDGDGIADLAVGAPFDPIGSGDPLGSIYLLFLNADGSVRSHTEIPSPSGQAFGVFGTSVSFLGDLDGNGVSELLSGAPQEYLSGVYTGVVRIHFLDGAGSVVSTVPMATGVNGFSGLINVGDGFGASLAALGDRDGDGFLEFAAGAHGHDEGVTDNGTVWFVEVDASGSVLEDARLGDTPLGFANTLEEGDTFGRALAVLGDLDGDGRDDYAVGAPNDRRFEFAEGATWILFPEADGSVRRFTRIAEGEGGFSGPLDAHHHFGSSLAVLGDLSGDGSLELAVGADGDDQSGERDGAVWILSLNSDGTIAGELRIGENAGGFGAPLTRHGFGSAVALLGDIEGDGLVELAVGEPGTSSGPGTPGAVWLLSLFANGTVANERRIDANDPALAGLDDFDRFGASLCALGDVDGDGIADLAVGAPGDDDGRFQAGAVWQLLLNPDASVKRAIKISETHGNFLESGTLSAFGTSLAAADLDGDGSEELLVGGGQGFGAVWRLFLAPDRRVSSHTVFDGNGAFAGLLEGGAGLGSALALRGDTDGDGRAEYLAGASGMDDGGRDHGGYFEVEDDEGRPNWAVQTYGCGINPDGSLEVTGEAPRPGATLTAWIDNPLGTHMPGAPSAAFVSLLPDFNFPCGSPIPNWGMAGAGAPGELLLNVAPGSLQPPLPGTLWNGPGSRASVSLSIPPDPTLAGISVFVQGALFDLGPGTAFRIGVTSAVELTLGS